MGSVKDYFSSLGTGIASLVKGLTVTGKEFVTPKITEKYPENRETQHVAQRFRACLELIYDKDGRHKCIACGTCERNCPNGTITVETKMVETPDGKKKKKLDRYIYDLGSCTFCQLCVTSCPTNALDFSNDFEQAVFTRSKLVKQLNYLPEVPDPEPTPEELAAAEAAKKARIEAAMKAAAEKKAAAAAAAQSDETPASDKPAEGEAKPE
ncbi:MAG: NADH-quinone oxidoreductase subunit I [Muribaculaceae bacterium]|nr:NADH-quinone oxidoreductase subunit I [Muribaculaceae bacterium]